MCFPSILKPYAGIQSVYGLDNIPWPLEPEDVAVFPKKLNSEHR